MIAGPNGSGKSTLTRRLKADGIDLGRYINPDEIYQTLDGRDGDAKVRRAQVIAEDRFRKAIGKGERVTFETVMSHSSKIEWLKAARKLGYQVVIYFVALEEPRLNIERVRQRVKLKGHGVPEWKIEPRYERCLALLPQAIEQCDRAVLFDNTYRVKEEALVDMRPFCQVRRMAFDYFQFYATDRELLRRQHEPLLPQWSRGLLTDRILDANELKTRRSTRQREIRLSRSSKLNLFTKYFRSPPSSD